VRGLVLLPPDTAVHSPRATVRPRAAPAQHARDSGASRGSRRCTLSSRSRWYRRRPWVWSTNRLDEPETPCRGGKRLSQDRRRTSEFLAPLRGAASCSRSARPKRRPHWGVRSPSSSQAIMEIVGARVRCTPAMQIDGRFVLQGRVPRAGAGSPRTGPHGRWAPPSAP
jgi:hypothetical protein